VPNKTIYIIGVSGSRKSTVADFLAQRLS